MQAGGSPIFSRSLAALPALLGALALTGVGPAGGVRAQPSAPAPSCNESDIQAIGEGAPPVLPDTYPWDASQNANVATVYAARGKRYSLCGDLPKALANFAFALRLDASNLDIYVLRGDAYGRAGQQQDALRDYSTALSLEDPRHPKDVVRSVYASRAEIYLSQGSYAEAIRDLNKVIDELKNRPAKDLLPMSEYRLRRARAYYQVGDYQKAEAEFRTLSAEAPTDWERLAYLGRARLRLGDAAGAVTPLEGAVERISGRISAGESGLAAQRAPLLAALGSAYAKRGTPADLRQARQAFQAALNDDPANAEAQQGLSVLPAPTPRPTFADEPQIRSPDLPAGVRDLSSDWPAPFCTAQDKNAYLDRTNQISAAVQSNIGVIADYLAKVDARRATYEANDQLSYEEKIEFLKLFDDEHNKLAAMQAEQSRLGEALRAFFLRVVGERRLVVGCDANGAPYRTPDLPKPRVAEAPPPPPRRASPPPAPAQSLPPTAAQAAPPPTPRTTTPPPAAQVAQAQPPKSPPPKPAPPPAKPEPAPAKPAPQAVAKPPAKPPVQATVAPTPTPAPTPAPRAPAPAPPAAQTAAAPPPAAPTTTANRRSRQAAAAPPKPAAQASAAAPAAPPKPAAQASAVPPAATPRNAPPPPAAAPAPPPARVASNAPPPPPRKASKREMQAAARMVVAGQKLLDQRQYDRAAEQMTEAHNLDPANADAVVGLATAEAFSKLEHGDFDGSIAQFRTAVALRPNAVVWNGLGRALAGRGLLAEAISAFEKATALAPTFAEAQFNRGEVYSRLGAQDPRQYRAAVAAYTAAVQATGAAGYAAAYLRRGQANFYLHEYPAALGDFSVARTQNHLLGEAIYGLARTQIEQKQYAEAIKTIGDLMQVQDADAAAYCTRGLAFYLRGRETKTKTDFQAAYADFMQAKALKPGDVNVAKRVSESQGFATPGLKTIMPLVSRRGAQAPATATLDPALACRL